MKQTNQNNNLQTILNKQRKPDKLQAKMWRSFIALTVVIMAFLWLLQIIFFNFFYASMKEKEVKKAGEKLAWAYTRSQQDYDRERFKLLQEDSVVVEEYQLVSGRLILRDSNNINPINRKPVSLFSGNTFIQLLEDMDISADKTASATEKVGDKTIMILGKKLFDGTYLIISSYLSPMGTTISILGNQLLWVTIIAFLVAMGMAYIISKRLTKPIIEMTNSAGELARGNYQVTFAAGEYEEMNELANTLNYATMELSKTEGLRRDFIASVSHDLRTPLTMIKAYSELIRDISGENKEKRDKNIKVIIDEVDRLSDLVTDCLNLSKLQTGTSQLNISTFDLVEEVQFVLNQFHIYEKNEGYTFGLESKGNDFTVVADKNKIRRVLYNLIGNAINYTGEDKRIGVLIEQKENEITFYVTDTGRGIAQEDLQQIWERYNRGSTRQKKQVVSTGLGLSIVKEILVAHQLNYGVNSVVGKGSTFWFSFKRVKKEMIVERQKVEN